MCLALRAISKQIYKNNIDTLKRWRKVSFKLKKSVKTNLTTENMKKYFSNILSNTPKSLQNKEYLSRDCHQKSNNQLTFQYLIIISPLNQQNGR